MRASDVIVVNPKIMSGTPCFRGTRVPVSTLFDSLAHGMTLDQVLESWPTLNRADLMAVLSLAEERLVEEAKVAA